MSVHLASSSRSGRRRRARPISEINVTPFVDVMLVLLIVFMVAAPLLAVGVPLRLPNVTANALPSESREPMTVSIDAEGRVFIQQTEVPEGELIDRLRAIANERPDGRVYVRADAGIPYGQAARVLGALSVSGYPDVGLVMESGEGQPVEQPAP